MFVIIDQNTLFFSISGVKEGLLIGETENVIHDEYETTEEVKAMTQEVIKTIRNGFGIVC